MSRRADAAPELELPGLVRDRVKEGRAKAAATRARKVAEAELAEVDPVAKVLVDISMAHLDRPFDYGVPVAMAADAVPGARVKVRFAGKDVDGFVVERAAASEHGGRLQPLRRVVGAEPVLTPAVAELSAAVAARYAGTRADVLRLAVPPRHAAAEKEPSAAAPAARDWAPEEGAAAWAGHEPGAAFLRHLAEGSAPRAVWHAAPGTDPATLVAHAVAATAASGRGSLVVVPDHRDVARLDAALSAVLGEGQHVVLAADAGPAQRYREFLRLSRGAAKVAVGTRAAAFAPVSDLGLVVVWDDGDDLLSEPRAPYPHVRDVLLLRAEQEGAAALIGGFARTVEAEHLLQTGWAQEIRPTRDLARRVRVEVTGDTDFDLERDPLTRASRVPKEAHQTIRAALEAGPVLLQTPRRGYAASLACDRCREPARCAQCHGPLRLGGPATPPECAWCGSADRAWACAVCGGHGLRAPVIGEARTAEEMGRAFPGVRVVTSSAGKVRSAVGPEPAIVVATVGAEPVAADGYAAVVLLDTWLLLGRPDLRTDEEALRRWSAAAALAGPGGKVLVVGDPSLPVLQALVRWDQPGFARREGALRQEAHLPPASRLATITGEPGALDDALTLLSLPEGAEILGPVPAEDGRGEARLRAVVRVPRAHGAALSTALGELQRLRAARKLDPVRIQVDPPTL